MPHSKMDDIQPTTTKTSKTNPAQEQEQAPSNPPKPSTTTTPSQTGPKRKRKPSRPYQTPTLPLPSSPHTYLTLHHIPTSANNPSLDLITVRSLLTITFQKYLGDTGASIAVDILSVRGKEDKAGGTEIWIRIPREDCRSVVAAMGNWYGKGGEGWKVVRWGDWLGQLVTAGGVEGGRDLFDD